jgi:hypothetical protein
MKVRVEVVRRAYASALLLWKCLLMCSCRVLVLPGLVELRHRKQLVGLRIRGSRRSIASGDMRRTARWLHSHPRRARRTVSPFLPELHVKRCPERNGRWEGGVRGGEQVEHLLEQPAQRAGEPVGSPHPDRRSAACAFWPRIRCAKRAEFAQVRNAGLWRCPLQGQRGSK